MRASICIALLAVSTVSGFAPTVQPGQRHAPLSAKAATPRKRDKVKKAVKSAFGLNKQDKVVEDEPIIQDAPPARRKYVKTQNGKKYEKIDCMEEKAYQILKDLGMIEENN